MSKNVIIKGTLILTIAGILTKLLGFYNRIFLTRIIGVKELGIYQLIFPIYILSISFCCQGISTAITKHVSYHLGKGNKGNSLYIFKYGLCISLSLSIIAMLLIYSLSTPISIHILKNSDCGRLLRIICVALPFVAIKSCINSYFIGSDRPDILGISHFMEQLIRIVTAYILAYAVSNPTFDSRLATLSVVSGEIFSSILAVILIWKSGKGIQSSSKLNKVNIISFVQDVIPITTNNLIFTLFASFEAIILPAMLYKFYADSNTSMELYGMVTGIVIPFLLFPATITTSLSTMLLPAISNAKAHNNKKKIKKAIISCCSFSIFLGLIAFAGYSILGEWACEFAFKSKNAGVLLNRMSFLCPFIYVNGILSTILNGLDKAFNNLFINILGLIIRILFTYILVPVYGINAYVLGMFLSYLLMICLMLMGIRSTVSKDSLQAS